MPDVTAEIGEGLTWPFTLPEKCRALDSIEDTEKLQQLFNMAAEYLWRWTGRKFGSQTVTVYPYHQSIRFQGAGSSFFGRGPRGSLSFATTSPYGWPDHINARPRLENAQIFLQNPLEIGQVMIDGETLDASAYELQGSKLVRTDGNSWPRFQTPELAVTYTSGINVPSGGKIATGVLACEFAMASINDPNCSLPQRLQSVTREGVSMTVMDEFDDLDSGRTGIWMIDNWVASITKSPRGGSVLSPEAAKFGGIR